MKPLQMLLVLLFGLVAAQASAHDLWVNAVAAKGGPVQAEMGYGHDFPAPEDIPEDRMSIFEPMQLAAPSGLEALSPAGKSYAFSGKNALSKGSYLVLATYKPTFWTNGDGGWQRKNRLERPDAKHCEEASMFGKAVLNVDGSADAEFISRPVGQKLEIVPLANPASINGCPYRCCSRASLCAQPKCTRRSPAFPKMQGRFTALRMPRGCWTLFL